MSCELCDLVAGNRPTKVYYEDEKILIVDCKTCKIPMGVWKEHKAQLSIEEREYLVRQMLFVLGQATDFREPRSILDHYHLHFIP